MRDTSIIDWSFRFRVYRHLHATHIVPYNMQLQTLWCKTLIAVVLATTASSQIAPKLPPSRRSMTRSNEADTVRHTTTKRNTSNFAEGFQSHQNVVDGGDEDSASRLNESQRPHSRKKRLIWITDDGRLALPPGTVLSITPTLSLPLVRYPLEGFLSNMTMSFPLTIDFDKLGLTDNENPLGVLPPVFARSMGRAAGSYLGEYEHVVYSYFFGKHHIVFQLIPFVFTADYIGDYLLSRRARSTEDDFMTISKQKQPTLPESHKHAFHGGERAILYGIVEDMLTTFGMDGKACLLRAICEVHSMRSLNRLGLFGEIAKLFFT